MIAIRFLGKTTIEGRTYNPGQTANFPDDRARMYLSAGSAQLASEPPADPVASRSSSPANPENHPGFRKRIMNHD